MGSGDALGSGSLWSSRRNYNGDGHLDLSEGLASIESIVRRVNLEHKQSR